MIIIMDIVIMIIMMVILNDKMKTWHDFEVKLLVGKKRAYYMFLFGLIHTVVFIYLNH